MKREEFITQVKALDLPDRTYVVAGSGPLCIRGLREANDIDIVVLPKTYDFLKARGWEESQQNIKLTHGKCEALLNWSVGRYTRDAQALIISADEIGGILLVNLNETLLWKNECARKKDEVDIQLIQEYQKNIVGDLPR